MVTEKPTSLTDALRLFQMKVKAAPRSGFTKFPNPRHYTTLEDVLQIVQYAHELGISHTQTGKYVVTEQGQVISLLVTSIFWEDQKMESVDVLPPIPESVKATNRSQDDGIRRTYTKKYALAAIYGIGSDEDDDANSLTPPPPEKEGVGATRTKPNEKLESTDVLKALPVPISKEAKEVILKQLSTLQKLHPDKMKALVESFRNKFNIKSSKISGHITTAEHGEFLALEISKIDASL